MASGCSRSCSTPRVSTAPRRPTPGSRSGPGSNARQVGARRHQVPFRATFDCLWCGRPSTAASRGRPDRLGEPVRRLPGARPGQPVPALPAADGAAGALGWRASGRPRPPSRRRRRRRPDLDREMRDYYAARAPGVRRLVPAPRPLLAGTRRGTSPGTPSWTRRRRGWTGCRSRVTSWSSPRAPAGGRRCWPRRASCRCTTSTRRRWSSPGSGSWPITCVRTCMSAMRGRSPTGRWTACSAASG